VSSRLDNVAVLPPSFDPRSDTIFGPIVSGGDVEDWTFAVLKRWSCTYLAEIERQHGLTPGCLPEPKGWVPAQSFDKWPEDQLPGLIVVSTGTTEAPVKTGEGSYRARWAIRLGVICSGATQAQSRRLAQLYLAAHSLILIQRPSLEGHANGVVWLGEDYTQIAYDDTRSLSSGEALFSIEVDGVRVADAGPITPSDPQATCEEPWEPWSTIHLVEVQVEDMEGNPGRSVTVAPPYVSPYTEPEGE
jgi:hypothetical protein